MGGLWSTCAHTYSIIAQYWPPAAKWRVEDMPDQTGRVILVTGASSGIGRACVMALAAKGAKVYVACRTEAHCQTVIDQVRHATGKTVFAMTIDLSSLSAVERAAQGFLSQENCLHALFNNGGVWNPEHPVTEDGLETTFGTNVVGAFYLTHLLMPALLAGARSSADGTARVVGTSSSTAEVGTLNYASFFGPVPGTPTTRSEALYAQSKLGVAVYARELARRYGDSGIVSTSAHPGSISTGLYRNLPIFIRVAFSVLCWSPEQGALTMLYCGTAEETKDSNGKYFIPWARPGASWQPQPCVEDPAVGNKLWEWMEGCKASEAIMTDLNNAKLQIGQRDVN
ncbi:NAD(P)-binding protein [Auriculariales sp. MPI-PUGE-AT-0066]|nr:NAD(P)-binding protein [Auriculariales sp. MPI-PUGE-AT-0066]